MQFLLLLFLLIAILAVSQHDGYGESIHGQKENDDKEVEISTNKASFLNDLSTAALVNILEEYGINMGEGQYSKEELVLYVQVLFNEIEKKGLEVPKEYYSQQQPIVQIEEHRNESHISIQNNTPIVNATIWELVKAQVQSDLAPFLLLLPKPLKLFVQQQTMALWAKFKGSVRGAVGPMLQTAGRIICIAGNWLVGISESVVEQGNRLNNNVQDSARQHNAK